MNAYSRARGHLLVTLLIALAVLISACNLSASPPGQEELTQDVTNGAPPTRTPSGTLSFPTTLPLTSIAATARPGQVFPTSIAGLPATAVIPPVIQQPNNPPQTVPVSIVILSPIPGNVVAGNVQVLGSAIHPQFLQYQLEYGPDPNPGNLWFPATGAIQTPVLNNLLGIWNTSSVQDGTYQLRLRVFLRDATSLSTVVNSIRIQNRVPTPIPTATPNIPRPIAAFTVDRNTGQAPLTVRFSNQSTGNVTGFQWNFGDGTTSTERNPQHNFNQPGLYTVTLIVTGPGGSSNVSSQVNAQSATPPNAGFTSDKTSGTAPLTVQFTNQSSGTITSYNWNFSDGTGSTEQNPRHVFNTPGTYNVFLTVIGPGGSSNVRREITVLGPTITPPPTLTLTPTSTGTIPPTQTPLPTETPRSTDTPLPTLTTAPTETPLPTSVSLPNASFTSTTEGELGVRFTDTSTSPNGAITARTWTFGDGSTSSEASPLHVYAAPGDYTVTLVVTDVLNAVSAPFSQTVSVAAPVPPPSALFTSAPEGDLTIRFSDLSTSTAGTITGWAWDFGDTTTSTEQSPAHTYGAPGDYVVSLTVTDSNGRTSTPYSQTVSVAAPVVVVPPQAAFTSAPEGDLMIRFTDASTATDGVVTGWTWDFGDTTTSTEQSPLHLFPAPGDYVVSLVVTDSNGRTSEAFSQTVSVAAPEVIVPIETGPSIVELTSPYPNVGDEAMRNNLRGIYENGLAQGNRPTVFSVAGDGSAESGSYLDPFHDAANVNLDDGSNYLQGIIDWYNATDLGGETSFNRTSAAVGGDWTVDDLLDSSDAPGICDDGESPLACELRLNKPSVVIISIGFNDVSNGTNVDDFRSNLQQVIDTAVNAGVIPLLTTVQPRPDQVEATQAINEAILEVADANRVPVYNLWAAFNGLPDSGLSGGSPSQSPSASGDITSGATANYGANARNRDVLAILETIRATIFPDAPTP